MIITAISRMTTIIIIIAIPAIIPLLKDDTATVFGFRKDVEANSNAL